MKKALFLLLTLLGCFTAQHSMAQSGIVNVPVGALRAAFRASFGYNPNFGKYEQLAVAINRVKGTYFPGAAGAFWSGKIIQNGDRSKDMFRIVTVGQGPFQQNPKLVHPQDLKTAFINSVGRQPDFGHYKDLALSINRYQQANVKCSGGFWNGEQAPTADGGHVFGVVLVGSPNSPENIPVVQLVNSFAMRLQRPPDFSIYSDMAFAVTCWIEDHEKGQAYGGFWNGEQSGAGPGLVYGIVMVR